MRMQTVADILERALAHAPEESRAELANALEEYASVHWRSWYRLREVPAAAMLTNAIAQGVDARPGSRASG